MTDADQEQSRLAAASKQPHVENAHGTQQIGGLVSITGRHLSTGNRDIDGLVARAAQRFGLDPCLIVSVMMAESGFNRHAVSPRGASGLMQLMPATAIRFGVNDIFDPEQNIEGGAAYLRWLLDRFAGDVRLALAGYNAGEGAVEIYGNRIPPFLETQNYVRTIYSTYSRVHWGDSSKKELGLGMQAVEGASGAVNNPTYNQIIRFTSSDVIAADSAPLKKPESGPRQSP